MIATVIKHLEDEIEESKTSPRDLISLNMIEITMDFNELQKRYNDMNDPNFWLQKAIQKQKNQSLVAIEGAIDYYKQGLRIVSSYFILLWNIIDAIKRETTLQYRVQLRKDWKVRERNQVV